MTVLGDEGFFVVMIGKLDSLMHVIDVLELNLYSISQCTGVAVGGRDAASGENDLLTSVMNITFEIRVFWRNLSFAVACPSLQNCPSLYYNSIQNPSLGFGEAHVTHAGCNSYLRELFLNDCDNEILGPFILFWVDEHCKSGVPAIDFAGNWFL